MPETKPTRILAIDPGMQYLGLAILEGEEIQWYGVKTFPEATTAREMHAGVERYLSELLDKFGPTVLVIEEPFYAQSLLSANLKKLTERIKTWAKWRGLRVRGYYPPEVKAFFCRDQRTKQSLAEALIAKYPFLTKYLSPLPWRRRYWLHVFDAIGLGLMYQQKLAR